MHGTTRRGFLGRAAGLIAAVALVDASAVESALAEAPGVEEAAVTAGGYFVPPLFLIDEYVPYLRMRIGG